MIGVLGINHKTANVDIREKFSFDKEQISGFADLIQPKLSVSEVVVLSTCNRTEIYFYTNKPEEKRIFQDLIVLVHQYKSIAEDYSCFFYRHKGLQAVKHLFSVTSGLDSMVIGEDQVVKQVKDAYVFCTDKALTDAILMRLFQKSFETSKLVRSTTAIQQGATSISYLAVEKCQKIFPDILQAKVLFVGAGETGRLVLQKMKKNGMADFSFTNRTREKTKQLAVENNGKALDFDEFRNSLFDYDIVVTATNAGEILISEKNVRQSLLKRSGKTQVFIDLSVPRNIEAGILQFEATELITIDDLQELVEINSSRRYGSIKEAEIIIEQLSGDYFNWYKNRALKPVIQLITENMQKMHKNELLGSSSGCTPEILDAVEQHTSRLAQKYIRSIIRNLIEINEKGEVSGSLEAIKELFIFETGRD
jgi:glutamyl-tRNA reductase